MSGQKRSRATASTTSATVVALLLLSVSSVSSVHIAGRASAADAEPTTRTSLGHPASARLPEANLDVAARLSDKGERYADQYAYAAAEPLLRRALAIVESSLGRTDARLVPSLINLADLYVDEGKYAQAEPLYRRSLAILEARVGPEDPRLLPPLTALARLYWEWGQLDRAEPQRGGGSPDVPCQGDLREDSRPASRGQIGRGPDGACATVSAVHGGGPRVCFRNSLPVLVEHDQRRRWPVSAAALPAGSGALRRSSS